MKCPTCNVDYKVLPLFLFTIEINMALLKNLKSNYVFNTLTFITMELFQRVNVVVVKFQNITTTTKVTWNMCVDIMLELQIIGGITKLHNVKVKMFVVKCINVAKSRFGIKTKLKKLMQELLRMVKRVHMF